MRRRAVIVVLAGAAAWPFAIRAQHAAMPVVGFLNGASSASFAHLVAAFRQGLSEAGYVEGRSVAIECRWADGRYDQLPALADDLVRQRVAVIAATGGTPSVLAAKAATATIPIVFIGSGDVVQMGFVASFNRPGGNVTGVSVYTTALNAKRLGLLRELVPAAARVAALLNPANRNAEAQWRDIQEAARALGHEVEALHASSDGDIEAAFLAASGERVGAMLVAADAFFFDRRDRVTALAARYAIPTVYEQREFATAGGLMSYGTSLADGYRRSGRYVGRILKGKKPADLPVDQSTRFEFVINLTAAKALGLMVPESLLFQADEVIE